MLSMAVFLRKYLWLNPLWCILRFFAISVMGTPRQPGSHGLASLQQGDGRGIARGKQGEYFPPAFPLLSPCYPPAILLLYSCCLMACG